MTGHAPITPAARWPIVRSRMQACGLAYRAIWAGDEGSLRVGHSGDVVTMLDDLNRPAVLPAGGLSQARGRQS